MRRRGKPKQAVKVGDKFTRVDPSSRIPVGTIVTVIEIENIDYVTLDYVGKERIHFTTDVFALNDFTMYRRIVNEDELFLQQLY